MYRPRHSILVGYLLTINKNIYIYIYIYNLHPILTELLKVVESIIPGVALFQDMSVVLTAVSISYLF